MASLVSPGTSITVSDQSQYISSAVGTVPLILLATAQDKTINGVSATGTSKANAGVLQSFGSQRELATGLGYPTFQMTSAGTPINGDELNEYGAMAAYAALGLCNQIYAIRADIDLAELAPTSVRPTGTVPNGTYWLDLSSSTWGIYEWNATSMTFTNRIPQVITDPTQLSYTNQDAFFNEPTPLPSVGVVGTYAVVATTINNRIFYKRFDNSWVLVGTTGWQSAWATVLGSAVNPTLTSGTTITINGITVTLTGTSIVDMKNSINAASIPGVQAYTSNNSLAMSCTAAASSTNSTPDGKLVIGPGALTTQLGIVYGTYYAPTAQYGTFSQVPAWNPTDPTPMPSGSVWFKTGAVGGGANLAFNVYNSLTDTWTPVAAPIYSTELNALNGMDPAAGGSSIGIGSLYVDENPPAFNSDIVGGYLPMVRTVYGQVSSTGVVPSQPFVSGNYFTLYASQPGQSILSQATITVNGTNASAFVTAVLAARIPNISAMVETSGAITLTHLAGGTIVLTSVSGQQNIPAVAGFVTGVPNLYVETYGVVISGFAQLSYTYSMVTPTSDPANGTYWYYGDGTVIDIMINDGSKWRGYKNLSVDARGYSLQNTDPNGVIVAALAPTTQTDNTSLVPGDLWLDTSDLENWPKLSRWTGSAWSSLDNTDHITQNGVVFADARWDSSGTTDPITATMLPPSQLLTSDYVDLDAPNPLLYPRGMLLVNTRRSGYNVKRYVVDYFNVNSFNIAAWSVATAYNQGDKVAFGTTLYVALGAVGAGGSEPNASVSWTPLVTSSWVTASGNQNDGAMYAGHNAQRQIVVAAMISALDSNTQIREDQFQYSLITAPGYPELIPNMVALNNDRANTAFVIGDTPLTLASDAVSINNWSTDALGGGLSTADPYLAVYYPHGLTTDTYGNQIVVPSSHMALRTYIYNDNVSYPWFAPAGTRRGLVDSATDVGYVSPLDGSFVRVGGTQSLRDTLYATNINPIVVMPSTGLVVWGQKTRNPTTTSMDRVNVARLVNYIRTILASIGNGYLFEPNDKITRDQIKATVESAMNDLVAKRGIYDYLVVCDTSNNTPDRIARNELYVDIAIEPMKDVEFIYVPVTLLNPGTVATLSTI
jgi:hypothetical protein